MAPKATPMWHYFIAGVYTAAHCMMQQLWEEHFRWEGPVNQAQQRGHDRQPAVPPEGQLQEMTKCQVSSSNGFGVMMF
jgi:hypothetical protein